MQGKKNVVGGGVHSENINDAPEKLEESNESKELPGFKPGSACAV